MYDNFSSDLSEFLTMMFGALVGLCAVVCVIALIFFGTQRIKDSSQPIRKEIAKVVKKEQNNMYILFEIKSGERLRLQVKLLNKLVEGDEGILTWQGSRVINFERNIM